MSLHAIAHDQIGETCTGRIHTSVSKYTEIFAAIHRSSLPKYTCALLDLSNYFTYYCSFKVARKHSHYNSTSNNKPPAQNVNRVHGNEEFRV